MGALLRTSRPPAKLGTGQFYMHGELHAGGAKLAAATKIQTALCLTHHPKSPPSPDWVAAEARRLRTKP